MKEQTFLGVTCMCQIYGDTPVLDVMARHKSQVVFSRRVLQDFAIYNQAHF